MKMKIIKFKLDKRFMMIGKMTTKQILMILKIRKMIKLKYQICKMTLKMSKIKKMRRKKIKRT